MTNIKIKLYGTVEVRVPLVAEIDREVFEEWSRTGEVTADSVLEFVKAGDEYELTRQFPVVDVHTHEVTFFSVDSCEILDDEEAA